MFRPFMLWVARRALRWYYREVRWEGRERIPATGPVLLIGNHPNDLPDVLAGYFTTPRPVRYLATVSVWSDWTARKTYEALDVIPVVRVRDARRLRDSGLDLAQINAAAAQAVAQAFDAGQVVGAFPEGGVHSGPSLGRLRTGVAKMLLDYADGDPTRDVSVVPFGLHYSDPATPGSDLRVRIGAPFSLRAWCDAQPAGEVSPGRLTDRLREALLSVTPGSGGRTEFAWPRPALAGLVLRAPLAAAGWVINGPVWAMVLGLARRISRDPSERAARAMVPGLFVVAAWYAALTIALLFTLPWPHGAVTAALLLTWGLRTGDVALAWWRALRGWGHERGDRDLRASRDLRREAEPSTLPGSPPADS